MCDRFCKTPPPSNTDRRTFVDLSDLEEHSFLHQMHFGDWGFIEWEPIIYVTLQNIDIIKFVFETNLNIVNSLQL